MIYYRGPRVRISHAKFEVIGPEPIEYAVADLESIWVCEPRRLEPVMTACSGTAALAITVAFAGTDLSHPELMVCGLLAWAICASQVWSLIHNAARRHELWALVRNADQPVLLFATRDRLEFGQVRRALIRALEANGAR
jgi:hypothetical protein